MHGSDVYMCIIIMPVQRSEPNFGELLKLELFFNTCLLSRNKQNTSHKFYMWHSRWASNLILLCLATSVLKQLHEIGPQEFLSLNQRGARLKTLDTIGNCQRPVFSLGVHVSQHMHKKTNLWKFEFNWSSMLWDNNERKNTLVTRSCVLSDAWFREETSNSKSEVLKSKSWKMTSFSKTTLLQREPYLTM